MKANLLDQSKADEFADRMLNILNEGALALMSSLGHRTGLFDVMDDLPPSTSEQIANAAELNERYVREWLGAMVAQKQGLTNLQFEVKDVTSLKISDHFQLITAFDAIHDQVYPARVLKEIANALDPDGTFLMQDIAASTHVNKNIDHPVGPLLYTISVMHCMTVSLAANGAGLGTMWGEEKAREMLKAAGFTKIEVKKLPHDFQNAFYIIQKN